MGTEYSRKQKIVLWLNLWFCSWTELITGIVGVITFAYWQPALDLKQLSRFLTLQEKYTDIATKEENNND